MGMILQYFPTIPTSCAIDLFMAEQTDFSTCIQVTVFFSTWNSLEKIALESSMWLEIEILKQNCDSLDCC